jgi:hypothetical protein
MPIVRTALPVLSELVPGFEQPLIAKTAARPRAVAASMRFFINYLHVT